MESSLRLALGVVLLVACTTERSVPAAEHGAAANEPTPQATPAANDAEEAALAPVEPWPLPAEVLSPWQAALILMDPKVLTAEQRRQRAYARRKAIMLNPNSATKKVLEDLARAAENGEIDPNASKSEVVFTAKGVPGAQQGAPPAGWRPPAEGATAGG